jgi:alpha-tubulin suppressor-like RCC1 family protein
MRREAPQFLTIGRLLTVRKECVAIGALGALALACGGRTEQAIAQPMEDAMPPPPSSGVDASRVDAAGIDDDSGPDVLGSVLVPPSSGHIAAGTVHACVIRDGGSVACWGDNSYGALGDGTTTSSSTPVAVANLTGATAVSAGRNYTCALLQDGTARCWGDNTYGQLGNGTNTGSPLPVAVVGLRGAVGLTTGDSHVCALGGDGTIQCWGSNRAGQLGAGSASLATPTPMPGLNGVTEISAGGDQTCALLSDGSVTCSGWRITTDTSMPTPVAGLGLATSVSVGGYHVCALLADGAVRCWGTSREGELGNGSYTDSLTPVSVARLTVVTSLAAGNMHTCAISTGGGVACWGDNQGGALGDGTASDPNAANIGVATPVSVVDLPLNPAAIAGGLDFTCALVADGKVVCWGLNGDGQLGNGTLTDSATPVFVQF